MTASGIQDFYAILGAFGVGFDLALAAGVVVTTNCGVNQFLGILYAGMLGGFAANFGGLYLAEHSPFMSNVGQGAEAGGVRADAACCVPRMLSAARSGWRLPSPHTHPADHHTNPPTYLPPIPRTRKPGTGRLCLHGGGA